MKDQSNKEKNLNEFTSEREEKIVNLLIKMTELQVKMVGVEEKLTENTNAIAKTLDQLTDSNNRLINLDNKMASMDARLGGVEQKIEKSQDKAWDLFKTIFPYVIPALMFYGAYILGIIKVG